MYCPSCGSEISDDAAYCLRCGRRLVGAASSTAAGSATAVAIGRPAAAVDLRSAPLDTATYAGFWRRLGAMLVDVIVLTAAMFAAAVAVVFVLDFFFAPAWSDSNYEDLATLIWLIVPWLYYALMESSPYQATLGKLAAGIVVTDEFGGRISFGRASGRYFAKWISYLTFFIGFVVAGFTKQKQALHDLIAGTLVTVNSQTQ